MAIGMTYEQYWYGDVHMVRAFYKAHRLRLRMMNETAWLTGAYVKKALDATVGNMFRKGGQPLTYPQEPIWNGEEDEEMKREETEAEREQREEQEALFAQAWMTNFVMAGKGWGKNK